VSGLPPLGSRGEGWFGLQVVLLAAIFLGGFVGPAWGGPLLVVTIVAGVVLMGAGALESLLGMRELGRSLTPFPRPRGDAVLVERGVYRHVRHPIYGGLILGSLGWALATASPLALAGVCVLAAFFTLKARREEAWLRERFRDYADYAARTRLFLPHP